MSASRRERLGVADELVREVGEDRVITVNHAGRGYRSGLNAARISVANSSGSSQAAKWPPLSASWKYVRWGYPFSTQLRGARKISPGNVVKPTGSETCGGACPAARAWARPLSQYDRAADAPVPPSQYTVMLSRMWSRVRPPEGCRSTKAREIL